MEMFNTDLLDIYQNTQGFLKKKIKKKITGVWVSVAGMLLTKSWGINTPGFQWSWRGQRIMTTLAHSLQLLRTWGGGWQRWKKDHYKGTMETKELTWSHANWNLWVVGREWAGQKPRSWSLHQGCCMREPACKCYWKEAYQPCLTWSRISPCQWYWTNRTQS